MRLSDPQGALSLVEKIAALEVLIAGVEFLVSPRQLSDEGLISWRVGSLRTPWLTGRLVRQPFEWLLRYPVVLAIVLCQVAFALLVIITPASVAASPWLVAPIVACFGLLFLRSSYGLDGADQLVWIIFVGLLPVTLVPSSTTQSAWLWFVSIQVSLAYGVAGVAKASARGWRDGSFLVGIVGTQIYGRPALARFLADRPTLVKAHARLLILWECCFLAILVLPLPIVVVWLAAGLAFHAVNAYAMGLNTFFWAFIAAYPAVVFCVLTRGW
jgi:hypothetical protein